MLFCIFVPHKAKPVLFLSRAVLLWTFPFPRKGFWHNVVLIKADFCSILFSFFFFFNHNAGAKDCIHFFFFFIPVVVEFFLFYYFSCAHSRPEIKIFLPTSTGPKILTCAGGFCQNHLSGPNFSRF